MSGISFKVKGTKEHKITKHEKPKEENEVQLVLSDKKFYEPNKKKAKKQLVVPLIKKNKWQLKEDSVKSDSKELTLEDRAAKEILEESERDNENWERRDEIATPAIPLMFQNKPPEGFDTEEKLDTTIWANESTLEDYDQIPIEAFGVALLRGMGWKEGAGIGLTNSKCVSVKDSTPKNGGTLGLGFDTSSLKVVKKENLTEEEKELKMERGAYVKVLYGKHKDCYGKVIGFDESLNVDIELTLAGIKISLSEAVLQLVTRREFKKEGKILNKEDYEEYKSKYEAKDKSRQIDEDPFYKHKDQSSSRKNKKSQKRSRSRSPVKEQKLWVRPELKVRFIDKNYKGGRYFKTKMAIVDVVTRDSCVLRTEEGRILEDISPSVLETVIPRTDSSLIMVVDGEFKGEIGSILNRDKANCIAIVELLLTKKVLELDFDCICEYLGRDPTD